MTRGTVSTAVAGGTGNSSGGLRTHLQSAGRVHPRERAAACARRVDIEHGNANGETGDLAFGAGGWLASGVEESDVSRRAAHVKGQDAFDAGSASNAERADNAAGGAGEDGSYWFMRSRCGGENAAGGLHDAEAHATAFGEATFERVYVSLQARGEIGVEGNGGSALVFAEFGKNLMRERDGQAHRRECLGDCLFVNGVGEGEEKRHGNGFGFRFANLATEGVEGGCRGGEEDFSVGADALENAEAEVGDGSGAVVIPVVEIGAGLAGNGERVFESRGGNEGDTRTFALEEGVGGDGRAVANFNGRSRNQVGDFANRFEDGAAGIVRRGGEFEHVDAVADAVDAISEGTAGIDGNGEMRGHSGKHNRRERRFCRSEARHFSEKNMTEGTS